MEIIRFEPWKDFKSAAPVALPIAEPPCKHCALFRPRVKTNDVGEFDGVVLCLSEEMQHDFSCYRNRPVNG